MDSLERTLSEHFGFSGFRPGQRPVVEGILEDRPVVAVMPTGAGKSLCYQLPAVMLEGITLVVSPLISLMKDQVDQLVAVGVPAAYLNSTQTPAERHRILDEAARGELKLLYVAPERFRNETAARRLRELNLSLFVVDEAHCISQWGHDFRPDYMRLGEVVRELGVGRVAAFTATATATVRGDIRRQLGLEDPLEVVSGFLRDNLHLSVLPIRKMAQKDAALLEVIRKSDGTVITYCATRKTAEAVTAQLRAARVEARCYHGGLTDEERHQVQEAFVSGEATVLVATNAFGMGIDKSDVRAVVHYDMPGSVEAYYQEVGRAGRDGDDALGLLLFTYADTRIHEFFISHSGEGLPPDQRAALAEREREKLRGMVRYAYEEGCRHGAVLRYFGEPLTLGPEGCGACDRCTERFGLGDMSLAKALGSVKVSSRRRERSTGSSRGPVRDLAEDELVVVQKALSGVARSDGRLTSGDLVRLLRGSTRPEILADPLAESPSFGILGEHGHAPLMGLMKSLVRAGCIVGRRPRITTLGRDVMWRRREVPLDAPELEAKARPKKGVAAITGPLTPGQRGLMDKLRQLRMEVARDRGVPAYRIATNRLLEALVLRPPSRDDASWLSIKGVGPTNMEPLRDIFGELLEMHVDTTEVEA